MPNHVLNKLEIIGQQNEIKEVIESLCSKKDKTILLDFNQIIPMPEELNITSNSWFDPLEENYYKKDMKIHISNFKEYISSYKEEAREIEINNFLQGIKNFINYGYTDWYKWAVENWGTKWNAYEIEIKDNIISFETAWSSPKKIFKALSVKFPNLFFNVFYADEDTGSNCGKEKFYNGEIIESFYPKSQSKEAYELAFKLRPYKKEFYKLVNDNYEYIEE